MNKSILTAKQKKNFEDIQHEYIAPHGIANKYDEDIVRDYFTSHRIANKFVEDIQW